MRGVMWWVDRWRQSAAFVDMTLAEQGAYRNLLDELWLRGGVLPNVERTLSRACGDAEEWPKVRDRVMAQFTLTDEGWRHEVVDEVMAESNRRAAKQKAYRDRQKAKRDGQRDRPRDGNVTASLDQDQDQSTDNQTPQPPKGGARRGKPRWDGQLPEEFIGQPRLVEAWGAFVRHREEIKKPLTPTAGDRLLAKLVRWGSVRALAALEHTMANGWQGVREPDQPSRQNTPTGMDALKEVIEEDYEHGRRLNRGTRPRRVSRRSLPGVESNPGDVPGLPGGASRPSAGGGDGRLPLVGPGS